MPGQLRIGWCSLPGGRPHNDDWVGIGSFPDLTVCVVVDGMGPPGVGVAAAQAAGAALLGDLDKAGRDASGCIQLDAAIRHAFLRAHEAVRSVAAPTGQGGGTADLAVWRRGEAVLHLGHIGDTRTYHVRGPVVRQLTQDHDLIHALIAAGRITPEEAAQSRWRNVLVRFLGGDESFGAGPDLLALPVEPGDRVLLSSDGLHNLVPEGEFARLCQEVPDPQRCAEALAASALARGSRDNLSGVVIAVT
jgi:protein phosphatase